VELAAETEQAEERVVDGNRRVAGGFVELDEVARLPEDGEGGFDPIDLVEHVTCRRNVMGIFARKRDLEPAGHRPAVNADPVVGTLVGGGEVEAEQCSPADGPRRLLQRRSRFMGCRFETHNPSRL